jgi:metal-responsive CopG/Arc/MetJ family transcriptional regulator
MSSPAKTPLSQPAHKLSAKKNSAPRKASAGRERVLIEFPSALLERADEAARGLDTNRSGLIRNAVEHLLDEMEAKKIEQELAVAYSANAELNRNLANDFEAIDQEGLQ